MAVERKTYTYTPFEYQDYKKSDEVITAGKNKTNAEKAYNTYLNTGYQKSQDVINAEKNKANAENALANYGDFSYGNQATLDDVMNKILNREKFSYDLNGDALYQQYKDQYMRQGNIAMKDAIGQAAAMTGGYGNSYAATVGNQAYQSYLQQLNDKIPELYQLALDKYNMEGQDLYNQYGMLSDDRNTQYGMWGDKRNMLAADRDYYSSDYYNAYNMDYGQWVDKGTMLNDNRTYYGSMQKEVEFTYNESGVWANLSFVDFVGPSFAMQLTLDSGATQSVHGLQPGAVGMICDEMVAQAKQDGQPWDKMCVKSRAGQPLRVISPLKYLALNPGALSNYYTGYVNKVWAKYAAEDLTVDTQGAAGKVKCRVKDGGNTLTCAGDNRGYQKPTMDDILGCNSGPFVVQPGDNAVHAAVVPRLCAAFYRSTLLASGGDAQPHIKSDMYYKSDPTVHYGRIVHKYEIDNIGYTFAYDDVNPDGENAAGVLAGANPKMFSITAG